MQLLLDTNGLSLSKLNASFHIRHKEKGTRLISPHKITSIAVLRDCNISSAAIRLAVKHQIPITFYTAYGKAEAAVYSASYANIASIRRRQVTAAESAEASSMVVQWFALKTEGQILHLQQLVLDEKGKTEAIQFLQKQLEQMQQHKDKALSMARSSLLGIEGTAARKYWQTISAALPPDWRFEGRSRQPALDPFNCMLNYLYGMTYNVVENAIRAAGLDPYFGFFHVDMHQRPTLVYDLMEPFRPWIDQYLTKTILLNAKPLATHFETKENGLWLSKEGRKVLIPGYNEFMQEKINWQQYNTSRKNHIHRFTVLLAQQFKDGKTLPDLL
jgi:CRISP-associated protein Cas1